MAQPGRSAFVATQDALAVTRMRAAGAIVLELTNLPELLLAYGRTNNPYDLSLTPGGVVEVKPPRLRREARR